MITLVFLHLYLNELLSYICVFFVFQKASPLSEAGKQQAQLAGIALKDASFDQIYSSPQERAFDTALWILKNNDTMVHDDAVQTIDKGARLKKIPIGIQTTPPSGR